MTTTSILALLRILIDEPNTAKWTDANLYSLMYSEYRNICNEITRRNAKYYTKSGSIATIINNDYTDLPTDCTLINKIVDSDGNTMKWLDSSQFNHSSTNGAPAYFDVIGRYIWWGPGKPDAIYTYTAHYHYQPTDLIAGAVPELPPNFHDILAYGTAVNSRLAKEDNIREYMGIYQEKLDTLLHQISIPQTNNPRRVLHTYDSRKE